MTMVSSRRANCPMLTQEIARQRRKIVDLAGNLARACHGQYIRYTAKNHWRASLVPAAAVIPAPRAYTQFAAVKKLVVGIGSVPCGAAGGESRAARRRGTGAAPPSGARGAGAGRRARPGACRIGYFEKIRVFKAGVEA